jgi:hypothetical protein
MMIAAVAKLFFGTATQLFVWVWVMGRAGMHCNLIAQSVRELTDDGAARC